MKTYLHKILFLILLSCSTAGYAQQSEVKLQHWQDSLASLGKAMFSRLSEPERMQKNFTFVKTLVSALKEKNSFQYLFTKLSMISILNSPDRNFRIFSWNLPLDDGSYLYYGAIQFPGKNGELQLKPLLDKTFEIKDPDHASLKTDNWYGAQYYDIQKLADNTYVLLGWKGHHATYTQKVIEVMQVAAGGVVTFGKNVFTEDNKLARKIFNYTQQASMFLKFNPQAKRYEFDHIVPADPKLKGNFKYYGPDLSFDAYNLENGSLRFQPDVEVLNPIRGDEDSFLAPNRKDIKKDSGF